MSDQDMEARRLRTMPASDVLMVNGRPMQFVDVSMLEMGYYPVFADMSKWGKKCHRRDSAVNHVKRRRKIRSYKRGLARRIQWSTYQYLIKHTPLVNTPEMRAELMEVIRNAVPTPLPYSLTAEVNL